MVIVVTIVTMVTVIMVSIIIKITNFQFHNGNSCSELMLYSLENDDY